MPRLVYLLGWAVVLVGLALALTDQVLAGLPGVTERNVRRIRLGMSAEEVGALLGGPGQLLTPQGWWAEYRVWDGPNGSARVYFEAGRVRRLVWWDSDGATPLFALE